jgi:hypothetical protein
MILTIAIVLFVLWILGLLAHIGGAFINILIVVALIAFIYNMITGRRAV